MSAMATNTKTKQVEAKEPLTFDFGDGNGAVPAHNHANGGGWVAYSARVEETVFIGVNARVFGSAWVFGSAQVSGDARVFGSARVFGDARVSGDAQVFGSAQVSLKFDLFSASNVGRDNATLTGFYTRTGAFQVNRGCFNGSIDKFIAQVKRTHGDNEYAQIYLGLAEVLKVYERAAQADDPQREKGWNNQWRTA